jgi:hypothetical protein
MLLLVPETAVRSAALRESHGDPVDRMRATDLVDIVWSASGLVSLFRVAATATQPHAP